MLQNLSQRYFSHNSNIKYVDSTIKYIGFESFHYVINLNDVSSFVVFSDFDCDNPIPGVPLTTHQPVETGGCRVTQRHTIMSHLSGSIL